MNEDGITSKRRMQARVSRAQLLKAAGVGLTVALVPTAPAAANGGTQRLEFPYFPPVQGTYTSESILNILNAVITTRYLVADAVYFPLTTGSVPASVATSQQIGLARFQYEIDFLMSIGAAPVTTTATLGAVTDPKELAKVQLATVTIFVSMFITAVREFAELGEPVLTKWMAQLAAREAESASAFRQAAGNPGLPTAFSQELFLYTRDGLDALKGLGLWGGTGTPVPYPGRDAILAAAGPWADRIIQRVPNNAESSIKVNGPSDIDQIFAERP